MREKDDEGNVLLRPSLRYYCKKEDKWVTLLNDCQDCDHYKGLKLIGHGKLKYVRCGHEDEVHEAS